MNPATGKPRVRWEAHVFDCANCGRDPSEHLNGKCLFEATEFKLDSSLKEALYIISHSPSGTIVHRRLR